MKLFWKSSAIAILAAIVIAPTVLAASRTFTQPTYKSKGSPNLFPIDAT